MSQAPSIPLRLPPRLSMDEYADFVEASIRESNPVFVARQKSIEKRVGEPFRFPAAPSPPLRPSTAVLRTSHDIPIHGKTWTPFKAYSLPADH